MKRTILLIIIVGFIGMAVGYFLFAKVGDGYIEVMRLIVPSQKFLDKLGETLLGLEKIRRNILICGAGGAVVGLVLGVATGGRKRRR